MLTVENSVLVLVDVQEKLARVMAEREALIANLQKLLRGVRALNVPILCTEQNPKGLGPTVPELAQELSEPPLVKMSFSCCGEATFSQRLAALGRKQVLLAGIETHVCVYQTARDLLTQGYAVQVVADGVSSRTLENKRIGLEVMRDLGARWTSVEMALFELLRTAEDTAFKPILQIVK